MTFIAQNRLELSLVKAATDPAHRPQFYRELAHADLFIAQEGPPPEQSGSLILEKGRSIEVRNIDWNGTTYIPVFSSLQQLQAALSEPSAYIAMSAIEFMEITRGAHLMLNPGADYGKELPAEEIASILDGSIWEPSERRVAKDAQEVLIGRPANYPNELATALSQYFSTQKPVRRAFLAQVFNPKHDEKPHTLIAIEVHGDWDRIVAGAGLVARNVSVPDPPVDFMQMTGLGGLEDYFRQDSKPFYRRRRFGIF
jgi:hypothetical protein